MKYILSLLIVGSLIGCGGSSDCQDPAIVLETDAQIIYKIYNIKGDLTKFKLKLVENNYTIQSIGCTDRGYDVIVVNKSTKFVEAGGK